jgi:hypothetical protein
MVLWGTVWAAFCAGLVAGALAHLVGLPFWPIAGAAALAVVAFAAGALRIGGG